MPNHVSLESEGMHFESEVHRNALHQSMRTSRTGRRTFDSAGREQRGRRVTANAARDAAVRTAATADSNRMSMGVQEGHASGVRSHLHLRLCALTALHATGSRIEAPSRAIEAQLAAAIAAEDHRRSGRHRHPVVVQTYGGHPSGNQAVSLPLTLESAKTG